MKTVRGIIIVVLAFLLLGCSNLKSGSQAFETWDEAHEVILKKITDKYHKEFDVIRKTKSDNGITKVYALILVEKDNPANQFAAVLTQSGELKDDFARCTYAAEISKMYDGLLKKKDYVLGYDVELSAAPCTGVYDTSRSLDTYIEEMNGRIRLAVELKDGLSRNSYYDVIRELILTAAYKKTPVTMSVTVNGKNFFRATISPKEDLNMKFYSDELIESYIRKYTK